MSEMVVGTLRARFLLRGAHSLKEKRRVLRSIKDRVRGKFDVAVAETDLQDQWQQAEIGIAAVGNDTPFVGSVLTTISSFLRCFPEAELYECRTEFFTPGDGEEEPLF